MIATQGEIRTHRVGAAALWELLLRNVDQNVAKGHALDPARRLDTLHRRRLGDGIECRAVRVVERHEVVELLARDAARNALVEARGAGKDCKGGGAHRARVACGRGMGSGGGQREKETAVKMTRGPKKNRT
jgi:hypothetical protein